MGLQKKNEEGIADVAENAALADVGNSQLPASRSSDSESVAAVADRQPASLQLALQQDWHHSDGDCDSDVVG